MAMIFTAASGGGVLTRGWRRDELFVSLIAQQRCHQLLPPSASKSHQRKASCRCLLGSKSVEILANEASTATSSLWNGYVGLLERNPLVMKSLTAGLLNAFADLFCQIVVEKCESLDFYRILSFAAIGLFMSGPGMHFWYGLLPRLIPVPGALGLCLRIAADQLVFTPLGTGSFFVVLLTLEGRNHQLWTKLQQDWLPTVLANWKVWIPFQLLNFGLVPSELQAGAACLLGVVWSVFISFAGHKS